ncbi:chaperone protein dnaJ 1, mitochondrial isoform X2 [Nymphaea colorata]|uniref:chaperone protein dnaJ 1, mitochondrial isoform X2 n=1 Tax=Nymphaea colorata TaxID=210225 RepID=UPI00129ED080|nr:chaperone protein dnaJ 1, mitochondrial isoform X2 [Nymphaea colorata]
MGRFGLFRFPPKSLLQLNKIIHQLPSFGAKNFDAAGCGWWDRCPSVLRSSYYTAGMWSYTTMLVWKSSCDIDALRSSGLFNQTIDSCVRPQKVPYSDVLVIKRTIHGTGIRLMAEKNLYEILGVSTDAKREEIKKAYHDLAKKYHPDISKNNAASKRKFQEIRDAYEILSNAEKRRHYDTQKEKNFQGDENFEGAGFRYGFQSHFSDDFQRIFAEIFESDIESVAADIQVDLPLSFAEAAKGCTKHISFGAKVPCDTCRGSGHPVGSKRRVCPTCRGIGKVTIPPFKSTCSTCKGLGHIIKESCAACDGTGTVEGVKDVEVAIPAGIDSGDTIRVPRAGNSGRRGIPSGNLIIKIKVAKDPVFIRDGSDIYVDAQISFTQAILGGKVEVPTLNGTHQIKIPKGVQAGQVLVLRGQGLQKHVGFVDHGDQLVRFQIKLPTRLTDRQRAIMEEFAKEEILQESSIFLSGNWWQMIVDYVTENKLLLQAAFALLILFMLVT